MITLSSLSGQKELCPHCFMHFTNRSPVPSVFFPKLYPHTTSCPKYKLGTFRDKPPSKQTVFDSFKCTFVYISEVMSLDTLYMRKVPVFAPSKYAWCDRIPSIVFTPSYRASFRSFVCAMIWSLVTNKNVTFLIFERAQASMTSAVNIWLLIGAWRLARVTNFFTVLPI